MYYTFTYVMCVKLLLGQVPPICVGLTTYHAYNDICIFKFMLAIFKPIGIYYFTFRINIIDNNITMYIRIYT